MTVSSAPTAAPDAAAAAYPIRIAPPEAFAAARAVLERHGYDERTVAGRLGGPSLYGAPRLVDGRKSLSGAVEDGNAALVRLLFDGETLATPIAERLLGADGVRALEALGVLAAEPGDADPALRATVSLYPTQGLWIASDRQPMGKFDLAKVAHDYVFGAINELTGKFLEVVPDAPGGRVAELCAGTGIAALRAVKRGAAEAWATDIVPRCVHFATFNAHLNGLADRVTVVESDAWDALAGETFDLVVAHPPYVPALSHRFDFRDAGGDGERVTRRVVAGLAEHLRPGGRGVVRAALSDRAGKRIAERVRGWLGDAGAELDLVVVENGESSLLEMYRTVTSGGKDFADLERWMRHFEALGVERFAICALEVRREAAGRAPFTERRVAGPALDVAAMDWHFRWARWAAGAGSTAEARLAGQRPRVVPGVRVAVHLRSDADREWHTIGAAVETAWPSHGVVKAPALAPTLLELCDGTRDVPAIREGLRGAGLVGDDVSAADVALLVDVLVAAAALEIEACPVPPAPSR